jgi:arabinose-5-phosphate isomerase
MQPAVADYSQVIPYSQFEKLRLARDVVLQEGRALLQLAGQLDASFCAAVDWICSTPGRVIVSGMGKAGLIGQKITATFSSTGTPAHFLHPAEAVHGDVGCVHANDIWLALSNSGETEELCNLLPIIKQRGARTIAISRSSQSTLAAGCDVVLQLGALREACPWGLAPTTSTTAMLALGDALAVVVSRLKNFTPAEFAVLHPAGSLGRQLKRVVDVMRPKDQLRIGPRQATVRELLTQTARPGRRTGAVLIVDEQGCLCGLFTDSDLARLLETRRDELLDQPISNVMTQQPTTVGQEARFGDIVELLATRKFSEIPVIDELGQPVGLIDITDVLGWLPAERPD